jgi:hypothetical protein
MDRAKAVAGSPAPAFSAETMRRLGPSSDPLGAELFEVLGEGLAPRFPASSVAVGMPVAFVDYPAAAGLHAVGLATGRYVLGTLAPAAAGGHTLSYTTGPAEYLAPGTVVFLWRVTTWCYIPAEANPTQPDTSTPAREGQELLARTPGLRPFLAGVPSLDFSATGRANVCRRFALAEAELTAVLSAYATERQAA